MSEMPPYFPQFLFKFWLSDVYVFSHSSHLEVMSQLSDREHEALKLRTHPMGSGSMSTMSIITSFWTPVAFPNKRDMFSKILQAMEF